FRSSLSADSVSWRRGSKSGTARPSQGTRPLWPAWSSRALRPYGFRSSGVVRLLRWRNGITQNGCPALTNVIAIPGGYLHHHVTLNDALAAQPGMQRQIGGCLQPVELIVFRLGKIFFPALHN